MVLFQSLVPPIWEEEVLLSYQQNPPIATHYYVQKLESPEAYNMIMRIKYEPRDSMPQKMIINPDQYGVGIEFRDDGIAPDIEANDFIYAAYIHEDINAFLSRIAELEEIASSRESVVVWHGHVGEEIPFEQLLPFNYEAFENLEEVQVDALLINATDCSSELLKQNSLFITDLSVVEDAERTYDVSENEGTPMGKWTFGRLMANIVNSSIPGAKKAFLKAWLKTWTTDQVVNGQTVTKREDIVPILIKPWLEKCYSSINSPTTNCNSSDVTLSNWECKWDAAEVSEADLLKFAPFKLTAIVNRMDLMGNSAYTSTFSNAGETRFIFTMIDPVTGEIPINLSTPPAEPGINGGGVPVIDWSGMNVIFEYSNLQTTRCELKELAQRWLDLSAYSFPSLNYAYNDALQDITDLVTAPGINPNNPNGSALARIRTNERAFSHFPVGGGQAPIPKWSNMEWEFRQFKIGSNHHLELEPLTNTPVLLANNMTYIDDRNIQYGWSGPTQEYIDMAQWIHDNATAVQNGKHNIPTNLLAASGEVNGEYLHYFEIGWDYLMNQSGPLSYPGNFRTLRQQYSLNTCQGCHNGETKTLFAHVLPLADEEPANYWRIATPTGFPDHKTGLIEIHVDQKENPGITELPTGDVLNFPLPSGTRYIPNVSAFLTGRNFAGPTTGNGYDDDYPGDGNDNTMNGWFYVNDPFNRKQAIDPTPGGNSVQNKYNDLKRRKEDFCIFINNVCTGGSVVFETIGTVRLFPPPPGTH